MTAFLVQHGPLVACLVACTVCTVGPRLLPLYAMRKNLPDWLKDWLEFVPAAVMAALVIPDVFFYEGAFNPNPLDNLFLLAGLLAIGVSALTRNFFATIVFAMAFVAGVRWLGWMA